MFEIHHAVHNSFFVLCYFSHLRRWTSASLVGSHASDNPKQQFGPAQVTAYLSRS